MSASYPYRNYHHFARTLPVIYQILTFTGSNGLDKSDQNVYDNTPGGFAGDQDIRYHEGTCQGGHPVKIPDGWNLG
jgi:hypothetical protein